MGFYPRFWGSYPQSNETRNEQFPGSGWRANGAKGKHIPVLVPLLIEDLAFSKASRSHYERDSLPLVLSMTKHNITFCPKDSFGGSGTG